MMAQIIAIHQSHLTLETPNQYMVTRCIFSGISTAIFAIVLCGCGPSAKQLADQQARQSKQLADQQARQRFREAVAGMKVCTQGSTYQEFREKRFALETSYTANQPALTDESSQIAQLERVMIATEALWKYQIHFPELELNSSKGSGWVADGWPEDPWEAMLVINPGVAAKKGYRREQCLKDPDFYAKNYVRRGLTQVANLCDELLK
jgi:hypothetical protein